MEVTVTGGSTTYSLWMIAFSISTEPRPIEGVQCFQAGLPDSEAGGTFPFGCTSIRLKSESPGVRPTDNS